MQLCIDVEDDFAELRGPPTRFIRAGHKFPMVVDRLEQGDFESFPSVEDAKRTIAEAIGPVSAHMCKRSHEVTRPRAGDATLFRDKVEIADGLHQAWIGLLLRRDNQGPIGWVSNVLKEVDRWKDASDDPNGARPPDL
jgi:hypothetical protein